VEAEVGPAINGESLLGIIYPCYIQVGI